MKRNALIAATILSSFLGLGALAADDFNTQDRSDRVTLANLGNTRVSAQNAVDFNLRDDLAAGAESGAYPALCGQAAHPAPNAHPLVKLLYRMMIQSGQTLECGQGVESERAEGRIGFMILR